VVHFGENIQLTQIAPESNVGPYASGKTALTGLSGEEYFKSIFFFRHNAFSNLMPSYSSVNIYNGLTVGQIDSIHEAQNHIINLISANYPDFFLKFKSDIESGSNVLVEKRLLNGAEVLLNTMRLDPSFRSFIDATERDLKTTLNNTGDITDEQAEDITASNFHLLTNNSLYGGSNNLIAAAPVLIIPVVVAVAAAVAVIVGVWLGVAIHTALAVAKWVLISKSYALGTNVLIATNKYIYKPGRWLGGTASEQEAVLQTEVINSDVMKAGYLIGRTVGGNDGFK